MFSRFGNILVGWCPGDIADLIETMTEEDLSSAITEHLRMFFGMESSSRKYNYYLRVISVTMNKRDCVFFPFFELTKGNQTFHGQSLYIPLSGAATDS